jgi:hypothetical protein
MNEEQFKKIDNLKAIYLMLQNLDSPNDVCFSYGMVVRKMCDLGFTEKRMQESITLLVAKYKENGGPTTTFDEEKEVIAPSPNALTKLIEKAKGFKIKVKWV